LVPTEPGFPVGLGVFGELHAPFFTETRTPCLVERSMAGNRESQEPFRGFLPRKTTPRDLYQATVIAKPL
jgi:hypothetical protein